MGEHDKRVQLSAELDGLGFYYGWVYTGDTSVRIDVLPPERLWRGDMRMAEYPPAPDDWIVYFNGKEFARVRRREDVEAAIVRQLTTWHEHIRPGPHTGSGRLVYRNSAIPRPIRTGAKYPSC